VKPSQFIAALCEDDLLKGWVQIACYMGRSRRQLHRYVHGREKFPSYRLGKRVVSSKVLIALWLSELIETKGERQTAKNLLKEG
jgi:hypothetical protein